MDGPRRATGLPQREAPAQQSLPGLIVFCLFLFWINSSTTSLSGPDPGDIPFADGSTTATPSGGSRPNRTAVRSRYEDYEAFYAGNTSTWSPADPSPQALLAALVPPKSPVSKPVDSSLHFARNITGFVRHESAIAFNLSAPMAGAASADSSSSRERLQTFLERVDLSGPLFHPLDSSVGPLIDGQNASTVSNDTVSSPGSAGRPSRNETHARELRGNFPWLSTSPLPPSIWADPNAERPSVDPASVPPRTHSLALTLREGLWGHAYNHPSTSPPLRLGQDAANGHEWTNVKGSLDMATIDDSEGDSVSQSWTVQGVHHRTNGTLYLLGSVEDGEVDIRDLPAFFPPGSAEYADVLRFVRRELAEEEERRVREGRPRLTDRRAMTDDLAVMPARTTCPLSLTIQLAPLDPSLTPDELLLAERELRYPTGLPTKALHVRVAGGVWSSWECGVAGLIEGKGEILRAESFWRGSVDYAFGSLLSQAVILGLMVWQMEQARAPAQLAKIAMGTISMQCALDGAIFIGHVMVGIVVGQRTLALMGTAFLAMLSCVMFGPRWLVTIKLTQESERATTRSTVAVPLAPPRPLTSAAPLAPPPRRGEAVAVPPTPPPTLVASSPPDGATSPATVAGTLPAPVTAPVVPAAPAVMPGTLPRFPVMGPPQQEAPSPVVLALFLFLLMLQTDLLPLFFPFIVFGGHFFWLPQIVRNASRGVRGALRWRYILGTTAARLWYAAYFGSGWVRDNVLFLEHSKWFNAIVLAQIGQLVLLALQDLVSPTFFLPTRFAPPPPYDYHPALATGRGAADEGGGGGSAKDVERNASGSWDRADCVICMDPLLPSPPPVGGPGEAAAENDGGGSGGVGGSVVAGLRSRELALAPCHHVFHTACLEPWMAIRSVCPQCRRPLPPVS